MFQTYTLNKTKFYDKLMNCSPLLNKRKVTKSIVWLFHYSVKELPGSVKGNESFILWLSGMYHYYDAVISVEFESNFQYNLKISKKKVHHLEYTNCIQTTRSP